tara:strand:- start:782 stop:1657 length:876 start_codon:yes stop_codon:yes gene_type:complete
MGYWRDMMLEHTQEASSGYIALPQDTDSIIAGIIDNSAVPTRSLWHDYKLFGTNQEDTTVLASFIDDGYHTTFRDLDGTTQYTLNITDIGPNSNAEIFNDASAEIKIICRRASTTSPDTVTITLSNSSGGQTSKSSTETNVVHIERIIYKDIPAGHLTRLKAIQTSDTSKEVILADIPSGQGEIRYRRYRVGGTNSDSSAHLLLKRRFVSLNIDIDTDSSEDPIHVPEDAIVKHALLGKLSEDNGDIQRAEYHWGVCSRLLEKDTDSFRGAAKPSLHVAPNGVGSGMRGMY